MKIFIWKLLALALAGIKCADGFEYVAVCPPAFHAQRPEVHGCDVTITAGDVAATVTVSTASGGDKEIQIPALVTHTETFDISQTPTLGLESKAVLVTSTTAVTVLAASSNTAGFDDKLDAYAIPQVTAGDGAGSRYFAVSAEVAADITCAFYRHFLTVAATEDGTTVELVAPGRGAAGRRSRMVSMDRYDVYTEKPDNSIREGDLVTGTEVISDKPVVVLSGNLCLPIAPPSGETCIGSAFTSLSPVEAYGVTYVAPPLGEEGYLLNVMAADDNTLVTYDESSFTLQRGQNASLDFASRNDVTEIQCSEPCFVIQVAYGNPDVQGVFMTSVTPLSGFYEEAPFKPLDYEAQAYLSVVLEGAAPAFGTDVFLDGASLTGESWIVNGDYASLYLPITPQSGAHQISSQGRRLAAYVSSSPVLDGIACGGYGYNILPDSEVIFTTPPTIPTEPPTDPSTTVDPTGTTGTQGTTGTPGPTAPPGSVIPDLVMRLNGTAQTADSSSLTPQCASAYTSTMRTQASSHGVAVNQRLASGTLCAGKPGMNLLSVTLAALFNADKMFMELDFLLDFPGEANTNDVISCAQEIIAYSSDHGNWPDPILPTQPGCPDMLFVPSRFNWVYNKWTCADSEKGRVMTDEVSNLLLYQIVVSDILTTADGSSLSADCTRDYSTNAASKTNSIQQQMASTAVTLCGAGVVDVRTSTSTFVSLGQQAYFEPAYVLQPSSGETTFGSFLSCSVDLANWVRDKGVWGTPIIPRPAGCPFLESGELDFDLEGQSWACVDN